MKALILTVCLAGAPDRCHDERVELAAVPGPMRACPVNVIPFLAEWAGNHPEATVSRWRCVDGGSNR